MGSTKKLPQSPALKYLFSFRASLVMRVLTSRSLPHSTSARTNWQINDVDGWAPRNAPAVCWIIWLDMENSGLEKLLYFEWSPPWHVGWRLSGEGCHWEYDGKNGEFENIDFRFPWLSDTSEMGFGHDVPFLNYSDRLPHPSDLCHPDRVRWG